MLKEILGAKAFKFIAGGGAVAVAATGFGLDNNSPDPPDAVDMEGERSPEAELIPLDLEGTTVTVPPTTRFNDSLDSQVGSGRDDSAWDDSPDDSPPARATTAANDSNSPDDSPDSPDDSPDSPDSSPASPDNSPDSPDDSPDTPDRSPASPDNSPDSPDDSPDSPDDSPDSPDDSPDSPDDSGDSADDS